MNSKEIYDAYYAKKEIFHNYINNIKQNTFVNIYTVINPTLIKNPYASTFPRDFFIGKVNKISKILLFLKIFPKFYFKNLYLYLSYIIAFLIYKIIYLKKEKYIEEMIIDTFILVDMVNRERNFKEMYFTGVYEIFEKYNQPFTILARLYNIGRNPFKLINFFKIINHDKKSFIFEFAVITFRDFIELLLTIVMYPFKVLKLLQKETNHTDIMFNQALIKDITFFSFESLTRYIFAKNIAEFKEIKQIYSWGEFQVIERSFNYAIRQSNQSIQLIACQFYLKIETEFNLYIEEIDAIKEYAPHIVLVNGKFYIFDEKNIECRLGISLRYKNIFNFLSIKEEKNILLLGSYIVGDTKYMLKSMKIFNNVIFKNHPAVDIKKFGKIPKNITVSYKSIYKLFENAKLVIGTASGSLLEAVACGISVLVVATSSALTANPLVSYGQGKIWDLAFSKEDILEVYKKLIHYRNENSEEIKKIALWYKENFFVEPSEENIVNIFGLKKE